MGASLEIIIPLAVALYGMHQDDSCRIEPAQTPLAENVCQGLRAGLHDGCERLLSVPLNYGITVVGSYSVTPAAFPPMVKQKIGEAYKACDKFWSGKVGFAEYRMELATKASVLNALFSAVDATDQAEKMNASLLSAGVKTAAITSKESAAEDLKKDCGTPSAATPEGCRAGSSNSPQPQAPAPWQELKAEVARMNNEVNKLTEALKRPPPLPATWTPVAELGFATGSHQVSLASCKVLHQKMAGFEARTNAVLIHGSADERGEGAANDVLSLRRAAAAAMCLASSAHGAALSVRLVGTGSAATPVSGYPQARVATIYVSN